MEKSSPLDRKVMGKSIWEWMQVFIVPLAIAVFTIVFSIVQSCSLQQTENQRAQDTMLQAYLDQMSHLLLEKGLRTSPQESEVRTLARARTLAVLERLDADRKTLVMQFLVEAQLIQNVEGRGPIISLGQLNVFDQSGESGIDLSGVDLSHANLSGANLLAVNLSGADMTLADLTNADLTTGHLNDANLSGANLSGAVMIAADLSNANLSSANLKGAQLGQADLAGANLSRACLVDARGVTKEGLEQQTFSLEGARMPDASKCR
jgi:uncharacterized protein YjbI with pentapeptide repeats